MLKFDNLAIVIEFDVNRQNTTLIENTCKNIVYNIFVEFSPISYFLEEMVDKI